MRVGFASALALCPVIAKGAPRKGTPRPEIAEAEAKFASTPHRLRAASWYDYPRRPAFEVNVLWPFYPGGIVDLKVMVPVVRKLKGNWRGEIVAGLQSDFAWRFVREDRDEYGRVALMAVKLGYRQFLAYGLHVDVTVNLGWRHEEDNPIIDGTIDSFQGRLWLFAGYQHEFTRRFYANVRGGLGVHLFRTDELADRERKLVPAGDLNLGVRF